MSNNIFEQIKKVNEYGQENWSARDLCKLLGYTEYGKFLPAVERAKESCKNSGQNIDDHFAGVSDMVKIGQQTADQYLPSIEELESHLSIGLKQKKGDR